MRSTWKFNVDFSPAERRLLDELSVALGIPARGQVLKHLMHKAARDLGVKPTPTKQLAPGWAERGAAEGGR